MSSWPRTALEASEGLSGIRLLRGELRVQAQAYLRCFQLCWCQCIPIAMFIVVSTCSQPT